MTRNGGRQIGAFLVLPDRCTTCLTDSLFFALVVTCHKELLCFSKERESAINMWELPCHDTGHPLRRACWQELFCGIRVPPNGAFCEGYNQKRSGDPNPQYFSKSTAVQMGGVLPYKWEAYFSTNGRCIAGFPFLRSLEARKVRRYKWGAYCRTKWRCTAVLFRQVVGVGVSENIAHTKLEKRSGNSFSSCTHVFFRKA